MRLRAAATAPPYREWQNFNSIYGCCTTRRDAGSSQAARQQNQSHCRHRPRIVRLHSIKKCADDTARDIRQQQSNRKAGHQHRARLSQHHRHQAGALRSQRDPDAQLARSLCHQVCQQSIDAGDAQHQRRSAKDLQQPRRQSLASVRVLHHLVHRREVAVRQLRTRLAHQPPQLWRHRRWIALRPHRQVHRHPRRSVKSTVRCDLRQVYLDLRLRRLGNGDLLPVIQHAHHHRLSLLSKALQRST